MKYQNKNIVGIWIDHQRAYIISTPDRKTSESFDVIEKIEIPHQQNHGGDEKTRQNKEHEILHHLYTDVASKVKTADAIFIIGPGTAQEELRNFLNKDQHFTKKEIEIGSADSLTMNEMIAKVRSHFNKS